MEVGVQAAGSEFALFFADPWGFAGFFDAFLEPPRTALTSPAPEQAQLCRGRSSAFLWS
jgi:hypothetical protein